MRKWIFARNGYWLMSIVFYAVGAVYILVPQILPEVQAIGAGVLLLVYGIIKIIGFWSDDLYCLAFQYDLACGVLIILLGICTLLFQNRAVPYMPMGLGWIVLMDSLLKIQMSRDAKSFGLKQWGILLGISVGAAILSTILIFYSADSAAPRPLPGMVLIIQGILNQCVIYCAVKKPKQVD